MPSNFSTQHASGQPCGFALCGLVPLLQFSANFRSSDLPRFLGTLYLLYHLFNLLALLAKRAVLPVRAFENNGAHYVFNVMRVLEHMGKEVPLTDRRKLTKNCLAFCQTCLRCLCG